MSEASQRRAVRATSLRPIPAVRELVLGETVSEEPIHFVDDEGTDLLDVVGTTYAALNLVSERFTEALQARAFTGWGTFRFVWTSRACRWTASSRSLSWGVAGPINDDLSETIVLPLSCRGGVEKPGLRGICFDPATWDGSDIFASEGSTATVVSEPVKDALETAGVTNVRLERITEIERMWRADGSLVG